MSDLVVPPGGFPSPPPIGPNFPDMDAGVGTAIEPAREPATGCAASTVSLLPLALVLVGLALARWPVALPRPCDVVGHVWPRT